MPYEIEVSRLAEKDRRSLPDEIERRVDALLLKLPEDPRPANTVKLAGSHGVYRLRVGDYRVVYEVNDAQRLIVIRHIRHRREVYRG